ncbi:MAG: phosphate--acyl-ACP acyltransferase, partial [Oscillospiraceae bacterium]|nr:phosphate--acyl-ACP acyltransferase [Oscillospiraceae bacterium]
DKIKGMFMTSTLGKIAGLLVLKKIKEFKKSMDYKEAGGAPLMGVTKPVIKAHGSSDGRAFKNAIRQARDFAQRDVIGEITMALEEQKAIEQVEG